MNVGRSASTLESLHPNVFIAQYSIVYNHTVLMIHEVGRLWGLESHPGLTHGVDCLGHLMRFNSAAPVLVKHHEMLLPAVQGREQILELIEAHLACKIPLVTICQGLITAGTAASSPDECMQQRNQLLNLTRREKHFITQRIHRAWQS